MLEVRDLVIRYGQVTAVHGVDLSVHEGEIVAVVGPNGAGKTSVLSAIAGICNPAGGTIECRGTVTNGWPPERIVRHGVALVQEGRNIFAALTVQENLLLGSTPQRNRAQVRADMDGQLDRFPVLRDRFRQPAGLLSGGEQQQLAIARALMSRPRLLLLDEPSLGLAPLLVESVLQSVRELREVGVTILLVEQNALQAMQMADRTYIMRTGRIIRSGTATEIGDTAGMVADYLGEAAAPGIAS